MRVVQGRREGQTVAAFCPLPERQKVSCLIYGALNEKAPKVHFKLRFDSSGVQLRAAVLVACADFFSCSGSLFGFGQMQLKRRRGMALTWPTVCFAFHCIWLPHLVTAYGYVRCDRIRFDAMSARSVSHSSSVCFFFQHLKRLWPLLAVLLLRFCMAKVLNQLEKGLFCTVLFATPLKRAHTRRASCVLCSLQQYCKAFFSFFIHSHMQHIM